MQVTTGRQNKVRGLTLIEVMLVLVVVSVMVYMSLNYVVQRATQARIDRTVTQMQQILNAGVSYYLTTNTWPTSLGCLRGVGYPATPNCVAYLTDTMTNPWEGGPYVVTTFNQFFYVYTSIPAGNTTPDIANTIAGMLPMAYATKASALGTFPPGFDVATPCTAAKVCNIVARINIPGMPASKSINFAGLYHHGACVPIPVCPVNRAGATMTPQIIVVPVSVSGVNDPGSSKVYPISSFTAYATGNPVTPGSSGVPTVPPACIDGTQLDCGVVTNPPASLPGASGPQYWRACLQVITEKGYVAKMNSQWGQYVTLMAITRCTDDTETPGSGFTVFSQ